MDRALTIETKHFEMTHYSESGLQPNLSKGKITITDGPFVETKEVIGGYAVFEVNSKQEMIDATVKFMELHREHWPGWEGETEIRQLFGPSDYTPCG